MKKHFARFGNEQDAFILTVGEIFLANGCGIAVAQVDFAADLRRDAGRQRDPGPGDFLSIFERPLAIDVTAMSEHAPGEMLEAIPLFQKIIPAMIADFQKHFAVRHTNLANMRGVNDQFPAIGQHRFQLVHAFSARPQLVIHGRRTGKDGVERVVFADDMPLAGKLARGVPRTFRRTGKNSRQFRTIHHQRKTKLADIHHRRRAIHHPPHRGPFVPNNFRIGHDCAEPMEKIEDVRTAHPGK